MKLPEAFVAYHQSSGALEVVLEGADPGWYQLWPLAQLEHINRGYEVDRNAPGYVGIGSDGGGEMIALAPSGEIVIIPFIPMVLNEAIVVARSWVEFEARIRSTGA